MSSIDTNIDAMPKCTNMAARCMAAVESSNKYESKANRAGKENTTIISSGMANHF